MKKYIRFLALILALALSLTACAGMSQQAKEALTQLGSEVLQDLLTDEPAQQQNSSVYQELPSAPSQQAEKPAQPEPEKPQQEAPAQEPAQEPEQKPSQEPVQEPEQKPSQEPAQEAPAEAPESAVTEDGWYYDVEHVVLYLHTFGHLPSNYVTKDTARDKGWTGGTPEKYIKGSAIGGDYYGNREGLLPKAKGRSYTECDIDTLGAGARGAKRLVFSSDGLYFYTDDHYESFTELTVNEKGEIQWKN